MNQVTDPPRRIGPLRRGLPSETLDPWRQDFFEAFREIITVLRSVLPLEGLACVDRPGPQALCGGARVATLAFCCSLRAEELATRGINAAGKESLEGR
ncbi:hypothetical protein DPX16_3267 [Anabarilius grahami]|uniref:Uncharacterized protein n=1 Tax=Anabarilius grahami TaxID=495550 RepID=A0A3N0Z0Z6_ANAGA|nr:hypothetical protein DPX16_3267 [Anabarilius grahami]